MGTMIQALKLNEEGYRGARFDAWNREVRGNNDLLNLSRPDAVRDIHLAYFRAGADIVSTNTFSSTSIAQADYGMEGIAYELNQRGRNARARGGRRRRKRKMAAAASLRARSGRPTVPPRSRLTSPIRFPRHHFRPVARSPMREQVRGLDRRRRRPAPDRNDLRHAERQGSDLCDRRNLRRTRRRCSGDDLRHDHRPLRTPVVGSDAGRLLEFGAARKPGNRSA